MAKQSKRQAVVEEKVLAAEAPAENAAVAAASPAESQAAAPPAESQAAAPVAGDAPARKRGRARKADVISPLAEVSGNGTKEVRKSAKRHFRPGNIRHREGEEEANEQRMRRRVKAVAPENARKLVPGQRGPGRPRKTVEEKSAKRKAWLNARQEAVRQAKEATMLAFSEGELRPAVFTFNGQPGMHVCVAGSFNNWKRDADVLQDVWGNGCYTATVMLPVGEYQYKFIIDGEWQLDSLNPVAVYNEFGSQNNVLVVS